MNTFHYQNKAVFLSNLYHIDQNTLLETNLRYDHFDVFENKITYKIGLKHNNTFFEGFTTAANYYTAYDAPSVYQLANVAWALGIDQLKPAFTKGYELSVNYKELLSFTYFDNKVEDGFDYYSDGDYDYADGDGYYNIDGVSTFKGLEIESTYKFQTINLNLTANYTHLFEAKKEDGSDLIRRPKDTVNLFVDYYTQTSTYGISMSYIGDRTDMDYSTYTEVSTGNYALWNFNYSRELSDHMKLTINVKNLFDKAYQSVYGYATEGRSAYARVTYSF